MKNLSIIIPHKNSLDFLKRLLNSIVFTDDVEVIVVDDNSDADVVDFNTLNSLQSENLKVIFNKESKGAGHARNLGLDVASGQWLIFADADDFFVDGAFDTISSHYDDSSDIIYFLSERRYSTTLEKFDDSCMGLNDKVRKFYQSKDYEDKLRFGVCVPWGRMFRHQMIIDHSIRFGETRYANDTLFSTYTAIHAKSVTSDLRTIYCFTANKGSLTHTISKDSVECRFKVDMQKNQIMKKIGKPQLQVVLMPHIYHSLRFGLSFTYRLVKFAIRQNINPFSGTCSWIYSHFKDRNKKDNIL